MSATTRVGVIGVGGMGACHARHVAELGGAELVWVADPDASVGEPLAGELGTRWVADAAGVLDDCHGVVIACPDRFHAGFVDAAFDRELAVLCEKPLTVELADAAAIVEREAAVGRRLLQLGFMRVYDERHRQVADALEGLGAVNHIRCVHRNTNAEARPVAQILVESVIHDIHTVRWLSGSEITEVTTTTVHRERGTDMRTDMGARMILVTCRLSGGGVATIEFDDAATGYEVSVEVSAEAGNVVAAEPLRAAVRAHGAVTSAIGDDWFTPFLDTYRVEMRDWLDSVRVGVARGPSAWDGYAAQAVVAAAGASDRSGRPEPVELGPSPALYREDLS